MIKILNRENTILNKFLSEIRDSEIQKDSMRFRRNLERIGEIFAYEISKTLDYKTNSVQTPLGLAELNLITDKIVLAAILRAALPFHNGFLNYFDDSENAFITAYRKYHKDEGFEIKVEYLSSPEIEGKTLIIVDPMLASGASMVIAVKEIMKYGTPKHVHIAGIISSVEGIEYIQKNLNGVNYTIWTAAIDNELTAKSYIVPGLGDAGDLAYGKKSD
jgi:uracil phosphoribosyltransferase